MLFTFLQLSSMSSLRKLIEDSCVLVSVSALSLLRYILLVEVLVENPAHIDAELERTEYDNSLFRLL